MRYTVRTRDGELSFPNSLELAKAYRNGLVDPDDEVSEEGQPFRKAAALPELRGARQEKLGLQNKSTFLWAAVAILCCGAALYGMARGQVAFALVMAVVSVGVLMRVTSGAYKKAR